MAVILRQLRSEISHRTAIVRVILTQTWLNLSSDFLGANGQATDKTAGEVTQRCKSEIQK